ncbi:hypothetical protein [[Kitasatospora] papulosa]|uniref:hypothetical protein n=1 Tax=[Kitasatospora] papulosa TaxID=1464011 RepID=UPI0036C9B4C9
MVVMEPMAAVTTTAGRAAGTLLAKAFQQGGRLRLGGREERRIIYAHFQACSIRMYNHLEDLSETRSWGNIFSLWYGERRARDRAVGTFRELQEALMELGLAGNAQPVDVGIKLFEAATAPNTKYSLSHKKNKGVEDAFYDALGNFLDACKEDLWYLPQWWQIWRPAWWKVRWEARTERREELKKAKSSEKD